MLKVDGTDIYMTRGDSAVIDVTLTVKDPETGEPSPYTFNEGDQIIFRLKKKAEDGIKVHCQKEVIIDFVNNEAALHLDPEDTQTCTFDKYRYEFELITSDNFHTTFIENQPFTIGKELEIHGGS